MMVRAMQHPMLRVCLSVQVAERSLFLWNIEHIVDLVAQYRVRVCVC